jgi:glycosyltransferase involved in cell wall biosynthesis
LTILFLDQFSEPGGAQKCLQDLMPEIIRRGWKPRLMVPGSGEMVRWSGKAGIPVDSLPLRTYSNGKKTALDLLRFTIDTPRIAAAVRRLVRRERIDMVYVNGPRVLPAVLGLSCPIVFHAHSHIPAWYGRKITAHSLRAADAAIIAISRHVAEGYSRDLRQQTMRVIYNGVADLGGPARQFDRHPVRIGIIGRIAPEKGQMDFVRAAKQISDNDSAAEFFVFGERMFADAGYDAQVRAAARNAPVTFCGWTDDVGEALRNLDILAVPSGPHEAATRVIIEAFSAGTPVVAYRSGGIPELVEHGRTGLLTDSPDFTSLARSIKSLMGDPDRMERLAAAGRSEWHQRFRIEQFQTNICDLLEIHARSSPRSGIREPVTNW